MPIFRWIPKMGISVPNNEHSASGRSTEDYREKGLIEAAHMQEMIVIIGTCVTKCNNLYSRKLLYPITDLIF
jgi:hypothetical protein